MKNIIFYNRKWSGCKKAREFLLQNNVEFQSHDVRKEPIDKDAVMAILSQKMDFYEKKGKKVIHFNRQKDNPSEEVLLKMFLGRSGFLRAPVLSGGSWIMAGFEVESYKGLLSGE